ncbi:MAG: DUF1328 family protein [Isosphaeraceae bacterium]
MNLLWWSLIAFFVAIVAGMLGFGGVASGAASVSKFLFGVFLLIGFVLLVMALAGVAVVA